MPDRDDNKAAPAAAVQGEGKASDEPTLIEAIVSATPGAQLPGTEPGPALVGECRDDHHPNIADRYLVRYPGPGDEVQERWLLGLVGVVPRIGDRLLLVQPANAADPVILGVLGGFTPRRAQPAPSGPSIVLPADEALIITSPTGERLVEIAPGQAGPVVRLLDENVTVDLPGKLSLSAESIELHARKGDVEIDASDDVKVRGERVRLN